MPTIRLPRYAYEENLFELLTTVWQPLDDDPLIIDFSHCIYYIPAAITVLITRIDHAVRTGVRVGLQGLHECKNFRYLQRIDFFDQLGLELPENFTRYGPNSAFVPLREVLPGTVGLDKDPLATELAKCVSNGQEDDVFLLSQYALGEVIANLKQHAERRGFVCAQYASKQDLARIGIADSGIGIRESFRVNNAPKYHEQMSDLDVLDLAMSLNGSSKRHIRTGPYGGSSNRGVGLTMVRFMVANSYGQFFLASGSAWWYRNGLGGERRGVLPDGISIQGTICSLSYQRDQVTNYQALHKQAWEMLGLTKGPDTSKLFT